jgi:2-furoate---CoA ligase
VLLYTSGTTGRPKGVPGRHRAERAAALAHVAQNLYGRHERTLGVMPLYHTMGIRSLLAMALVDGAFVCLRRFDAAAAFGSLNQGPVENEASKVSQSKRTAFEQPDHQSITVGLEGSYRRILVTA